MHLERFLNRRMPSYVLFVKLHCRLCEARAFQVRSHIGLERTTCTPVVEEAILREFGRNSQTNLRSSGRVLGVHRSNAMRILHKDT